MKVSVKLFAIAKQLADCDEIDLELGDNPTVKSLRSALLTRLPGLSAMQDTLRFAINSEYADESTAIQEEDEVACIPPVSGG